MRTRFFYSKVLRNARFTVLAIDIDEKVVREIKEESNIMSIVADAHLLPLRSDSADLILSMSLIEHLEHPEEHIKESSRVLKCGSIFFIQIPNLKYIIEPHTCFPLLGLMPKSLKMKIIQFIGYYINFDVTLNYLLNILKSTQFKYLGLRYLYHNRLMKLFKYPPSYIIVAINAKSKTARDINNKRPWK